MANVDSYSQALGKILNELEEIYGLKEVAMDTRKVCDMPIVDLMKHQGSIIKEYDSEYKTQLNNRALRCLVHLSYLSSRMKYYKKIRLDFSKYPSMSDIAYILILFTSKNTNKSAINQLNKIVVVLSAIESKSAKARNAIGYRFLRIFIILILNGNFTNASIIADFILNQFIIKK